MSNHSAPLHHQLIRSVGALVLGLAALGSAAHVLAATKANETYKQESAACTNGSSNQDRATCLREAGAARYEAGRNQLTSPDADQLKANAMKRCEGLPQANRVDCESRVNGGGVADGSVREGGIYRETVTIVPGKPENQ